jgi:hypothetical protein
MNQFLKSIGDFFGDVGKGLGVASNDVVHAAGVAGSFIAGAIVPFLAANDVPALKAYFLAGGALNLPGIVAIVVSSTLTGLVTLASKSPDNVISSASALITPTDVQKIAASVASKVGVFLIGFLLLASTSQAGILSYVGVPLNPGVGVTSDNLLVGPVEIGGVNINNGSQVDLGLGFGLIDASVTGLSATTSTISGNWAIGILGKAYLQNTNPDYVAGTFGVFGAFNLVQMVFNNSDFPLVSLSAERLPDGTIQGFFNLVDLLGLGSNSSYRKINR